MEYYVYPADAQTQIAEENGVWLYLRSIEPDFDRNMGTPVDPQLTECHDWGKVMSDGRIAVEKPLRWLEAFTGELLYLTEEDFPQPEEI